MQSVSTSTSREPTSRPGCRIPRPNNYINGYRRSSVSHCNPSADDVEDWQMARANHTPRPGLRSASRALDQLPDGDIKEAMASIPEETSGLLYYAPMLRDLRTRNRRHRRNTRGNSSVPIPDIPVSFLPFVCPSLFFKLPFDSRGLVSSNSSWDPYLDDELGDGDCAGNSGSSKGPPLGRFEK